MTLVTPPYPKRVLSRSKFMQRAVKPWLLFKLTRCALSMIPEGFYKLDIAEVKLPTQRSLFPMNPADVKRVLIDESEDFPKSTMVEETLGLLIGDSIFVSNGDVWRRQRRMMTPAFEHTRVKVVFDMMKTAAASMIERLDRIADGRAYDIEEEMTFVTADIIFRTIFSRPLQIDEARVIFEAFRTYQEAAFSQGLFRILRVPKWVTYPGFRRAKISAKAIRGVLDAIIKARYDSFHAGEPQTHTDILQSLVSQKDEVTGTYFDLRELCEQVAMLFLAGHETSASALSSTLWLMTLDPDVQERMHREAVEAMGDREIEFGDLRKLNLTRNAFTEAMRLYPPFPSCRGRRRSPAPSAARRRTRTISSRSRPGSSTAIGNTGRTPTPSTPTVSTGRRPRRPNGSATSRSARARASASGPLSPCRRQPSSCRCWPAAIASRRYPASSPISSGGSPSAPPTASGSKSAGAQTRTWRPSSRPIRSACCHGRGSCSASPSRCSCSRVPTAPWT